MVHTKLAHSSEQTGSGNVSTNFNDRWCHFGDCYRLWRQRRFRTTISDLSSSGLAVSDGHFLSCISYRYSNCYCCTVGDTGPVGSSNIGTDGDSTSDGDPQGHGHSASDNDANTVSYTSTDCHSNTNAYSDSITNPNANSDRAAYTG